MLSNSDVVELTEFRRILHRFPELSGEESNTARKVQSFLDSTGPDRIVENLGGTGLAIIYEGKDPGPSIMFRAELDALPIFEQGAHDHKSTIDGKGHLCGHDGHMAILCGLGRLLGRQRPDKGRVILLFQPAEETGQGAAAVLADPRFSDFRPDLSFSLHNLPGLPLGQVTITRGPCNCTSCGMSIRLSGKTAHASMPETGISPANAVAHLIPALSALSTGGDLKPGYRLVTLTHTRIGEEAFGIAPADAHVMVTLRCLLDEDMAALKEAAEALVHEIAEGDGLECSIEYSEHFYACSNDPQNVDLIQEACVRNNVKVLPDPGPFRFSEDFGLFATISGSAMFMLGSGETHPQLHNPDYDFPDELIPLGITIFHQLVKDVLEPEIAVNETA